MTTVEKDLLQLLQQSPTTHELLEDNEQIACVTADTAEFLINRIRKKKFKDRWTALERLLAHLGDVRLICKYCVVLCTRWEEMEPLIKDSPYLWNYLHFCLRGVPIQAFRDPSTITVEQIAAQDNAETQRMLVELMGVDRFLELANPTVLDHDEHPHNGKRMLVTVPSIMTFRWLVCACPSTGRMYFLSVPPWGGRGEIKTCEEADQWLTGDIKAVQVGRT